jgi:hypothetical protein
MVSEVHIYSKDVQQSLGKGVITDINEQGLKFVSPYPLNVGSEYSLHFGIPSQGWRLDFFGQIVYAESGVSSKAYGVKFAPNQGTFLLKLV